MKTKPLDKSLLKGLKYSPQTGIIYRSVVKNSGKAGPVLSKEKRGYLKIKINNKNYKQHRLAFTFMGGHPTEGKIVDHINGKLDDNRWCNLRLVTIRENSLNQKRHRDGKEPYVRHHEKHGTWSARKKINGAWKHLGSRKTKEEAVTLVKEFDEIHPSQ